MTTPQDYERLSAYLDNQLPPADRAALEARLAREPELQTALRELRLTVRALRSLPAVRPPRSFVLRPEQVGAARRARGGLFGGLRLAAALSALVLAVLLVGDFGGLLPASPAATTAQVAEESEGGPAQDAAATEAVSAAMAPVEPTPTAPGRSVDQETVLLYSETPEPATGGADAPDEATPEMAMLTAPPTETPSPERSLNGSGEGRKEAPTQAPVAEIAAAGTAAPTPALVTDLAEQPAPPQLSTLRLIEAGLAILVVLLGLGAWFARRGA
jgi:anti-sigma factor RsiW